MVDEKRPAVHTAERFSFQESCDSRVPRIGVPPRGAAVGKSYIGIGSGRVQVLERSM
jgi:hypothetical protein